MKTKILIIEDELTIREDIIEIFELGGYKVYSASNGKEGIKVAIFALPDLIICDINMPEMDGYQVKINLDSDERTSGIPFIFLTARTDIQDARKALELGADDYIIKPIQVKKLLDLVSKRLKRIEGLNPIKTNERNEGNISEDGKILLKSGYEYLLKSLEDIILIKASADYTEVFINDGKKILLKKTLKSWEEILPEKLFIRIHRNTIINLSYIEKIESLSNRSYIAHIKNIEEPVIFSQRYSQKIKKKLMIK